MRGRRTGSSRCWRSATSTACTAAIARFSTALQRVAHERRATSVVMTFDPHPPRVVRPDKAPPLLMTKAQKLEALAQAGVDGAAIVRFTHELSQWEPETFVRTVLVEWLRVSEVWVGANFLFGHDRSGNFSLLRTLGARYGFKAEKIDPVRYKDFVVSSTRVRRLVSEARVDEAAALLGPPVRRSTAWSCAATQRGRDHRISDGEPLHRERADAAARRLRDDAPSSTASCMPSVTNIGTRPTVDASGRTSIETHIFDLDRDLYGAPLRLAFVQRLRDERAFESLDAAEIPDRRRLRARPRAVRSPFTVESPFVAAHRLCLRADASAATRTTRRDADRLCCGPCSPHAGYAGDTLRAARRRRSSGARAAAPAGAAVRRAVRGARRRTADRRVAGRARLAHDVPAAHSDEGSAALSDHASLQHPHPQRRAVHARRPATPSACTPAA